MRLKFTPLAINFETETLIENFLAAAVVSILVIRAFLSLTNYPIIGGGGFHIAHLLWGGLLLTAALLIQLIILNRSARTVASIIGGIGFGTFIDELGKFITADNNYFYQPTVVIIYSIFLMIYLGLKLGKSRRKLRDLDFEINALEIVKEVFLNDLDQTEKNRALELLKKGSDDSVGTKALRRLLLETEALAAPPIGMVKKEITSLVKKYRQWLQGSRLFRLATVALGISIVVSSVEALLDLNTGQSVAEWGQVISSLLSFVVFVVAVFEGARSITMTSLKYFRMAVLISIFLTQFFMFYNDQLVASINLMVAFLILNIIQGKMRHLG